MRIRLSVSVGALAALATGAALGQDLSKLPNDELCIAMAVSMIQGDQPTKDAVRTALKQRGEVCEPADMYLKIGQARLQFLQAQQGQVAQQAAAAEQAKADRDAHIRKAGQAWLIYQAQQDAQRRANTPKTTTCSTFFDTVTCDTR